jgi:TRAP-type mannitol/chloroaromatic compound transport system substrate-binding protein
LNQFWINMLKFISAISLLAFFLSGCEQQQKQFGTHNWMLQSQAVATSTSYLEIEKFTHQVALMSGGRLIITPYSAGSLVHGPDIFNAVSENKVQMGNGWPNWWSAQHPAWSVMNAGPFDFMNIDASMMFFYEEGGQELANELSSIKGVIWRPAWWTGMEFGLASKEPILGLDDLEGKKIRIGPGLPSEVLARASNSLAIPLVPEEIKPSLESGHIDGVEWTTSAGIVDLDIVDSTPYGLVPAIWQPSVLADFLINKQAYDALSPDLQAILETAIKAYALTTTMKAKVGDIRAAQLLKQRGMKISKWSDADLERWKVASDEILLQYKQNDAFSKRLIEKKQSFKKEYDEYYELFGPYE